MSIKVSQLVADLQALDQNADLDVFAGASRYDIVRFISDKEVEAADASVSANTVKMIIN